MSGDDSKTRFESLDDSGNYPEWSIRMEAELTRRGLLEVVVFESNAEGTVAEVASAKEAWKKKRTAKKMAEARAEIILQVKDSQLAHMRDRDPMAIWETLAQVHTARGFATRLALRRKLLRMTKGAEEPMSGWVGRVKALSFKLEDIGVAMTDEDRILALTNGLDDTFESFIISLDATPTAQTLDYVVDRLLNEEVRRTNREVKEMGKTGVDSAYLMSGRRPASGQSGGGTDGVQTCWRCGKEGHIRAFCKEVPDGHGTVRGATHIAIGITDVSSLQELGTWEVGQLY